MGETGGLLLSATASLLAKAPGMPAPQVLTAEDKQILTASLDDASIFTEYYFGQTLYPHQLAMCHARQNSLLLLAGRGAGKTHGFALKYLWMLTVMPDFRIGWGSYTADQAAIPFLDTVKPLVENSERFQKFLPRGMASLVQKPYPKITVKVPGTRLPASWMIFKTVGQGADTWRGMTLDVVHLDEGGLILDERVITTTRPAMRGLRWNGEPRLAQLAVSTTPTAAPWLRDWWERSTNREYFDYAPQKYFAIQAPSSANKAITEDQLEAFSQDMSEEERRVEIEGGFPEYMGTDFAPVLVDACQDRTLNAEVIDMIEREVHGAEILHAGKTGIVRYLKPVVDGHRYILSGDPGMGNPPYRNAPCVMVWDVTYEPFELVYFEWIYGNGSYKPFMNKYGWAQDYYQPLFSVFDATGTQKAMDELVFEASGRLVEGLSVTTDKPAMLNAAKILMQRGKLRFPFIQGFRLQLLNYKADEDKKLAQDTVMTLAMAAWKMRIFSYQAPETIQKGQPVDDAFLAGREFHRDADRAQGRRSNDAFRDGR